MNHDCCTSDLNSHRAAEVVTTEVVTLRGTASAAAFMPGAGGEPGVRRQNAFYRTWIAGIRSEA